MIFERTHAHTHTHTHTHTRAFDLCVFIKATVTTSDEINLRIVFYMKKKLTVVCGKILENILFQNQSLTISSYGSFIHFCVSAIEEWKLNFMVKHYSSAGFCDTDTDTQVN